MNETHSNDHPQATACDQLSDLLPAYQLGLTDADESALVERLLAECPDQRPESDAYAALGAAMLTAAPQMTPPPDLGARIIAATRPAPDAAPVVATLPRPVHRPRAILAAAAALVAVLLAALLPALTEVARLRDDRADLLAELAQRDALLALAAGQDLLRFDLSPVTDDPDSAALATLICDPQATVALLRVAGFPPNAPDRSYQAWLNRDGERISAGVFEVDAEGVGTLVFEAPLPLGAYQWMGITEEPAGGSPGPTTAPLVRGSLYAPA